MNISTNSTQFITPLKNNTIIRTTNAKVGTGKKLSLLGKEMLNETKMYFLYTNKFDNLKTKVIRFFSISKLLEGILNAFTVQAGATVLGATPLAGTSLTSWDSNRLLSGKHVDLHMMGAEHVQIKSKTGDIVDAHHLNADNLLSKLDDMGGKPKVLQMQKPEKGVYPTKIVRVGNDELVELAFVEPPRMDEIAALELKLGKERKKLIIDNSDAGNTKYYITDTVTYSMLKQTQYNKNNKNQNENPEFQLETTVLKDLSEPFKGFVFRPPDADPDEAQSMLRHLGAGGGKDKDGYVINSAWEAHKFGETTYLIRKDDFKKLELTQKATGLTSDIKLNESDPSPSDKKQSRGTVLLTYEQMGSYEQHMEEIFSFALEGMDVMMYNTPGKGLSTGLPDTSNINASIEAVYQFLSQVKGVKDENILAKGICFGAAPTAWLGAQHPKINLMLDQNPANFWDVAIDDLNDTMEKVMGKRGTGETTSEKIKNNLLYWPAKLIKNNFVVRMIAKAIFSGYNVTELLKQNKGNKIFNINVEARGKGGDEVVPKHHPEEMFGVSSEENSDKLSMVSMNPGATHMDNWWDSTESWGVVINFLEKTGLVAKPSQLEVDVVVKQDSTLQSTIATDDLRKTESQKEYKISDLRKIDNYISKLEKALDNATKSPEIKRINFMLEKAINEKKMIEKSLGEKIVDRHEKIQGLSKIYRISKAIGRTLLPSDTSAIKKKYTAAKDGMLNAMHSTPMDSLRTIIKLIRSDRVNELKSKDLEIAIESITRLRKQVELGTLSLHENEEEITLEDCDATLNLLKELQDEISESKENKKI